MSLYIIYIIRLKNPIKRHFCHLMCKNAAEDIRKIILFAIYRNNGAQLLKTDSETILVLYCSLILGVDAVRM